MGHFRRDRDSKGSEVKRLSGIEDKPGLVFSSFPFHRRDMLKVGQQSLQGD
jgi:hypothetical protein